MQIDQIIKNHFEQLSIPNFRNIFYQYRTISLKHFPEMQNFIEKLQKDGSWGTHPTYKYYMKACNFKPPYELSNANSVIILAYFKPHARLNLHYNGNIIPTMIPSPYYDEVENSEIYQLIREEILPHSNSNIKLKITHQLPFKTLSVRSGLGHYGRNNICYVPGFGSSITLRAILVDCELEDHWTDLTTLEECNNCNMCERSCLNRCINQDDFVIKVDRCLSLYNEINGKIPKWILPEAHHCLIGCLKCQFICPANRDTIHLVNTLEDLSEEEVSALLVGEMNALTKKIVIDKLKFNTIEYIEQFLTTLQRNLSYLLNGALVTQYARY